MKSQELLDRVIADTSEHISDAGLRGSSAKLLPAGSVLMAMYGANVGQLGYLGVGATVNQAICAMITNPEVTDSRFLYYALSNARRDLVAKAHGAAQQNLSQQLITPFRLSVPDIETQRNIGAILRAFDELIDNNRRRVELLEGIARLIYSEWFVHFRYPSRDYSTVVDSPDGRVPDGWSEVPLFDVADVGFGFSFKAARFSDAGPYPVIRIRDVPAGVTKTFSDEPPAERYRVRDGDVLVGMDGDFHLRQWRGGDAWLNQRVTRLRPTNGMSALHLMLGIAEQIRTWNGAIVGTTVAHLGKRHLEQVRVRVPAGDLLGTVTGLFDDIAAQACRLERAGRQLAAMRDLLLPGLVTGQIDVSSLNLDPLVEESVA